MALRRTSPPELVLWPTGPREPIKLPNENIADYYYCNWLPDGKRILFTGNEPGHGPRCYIQAIDGGKARPLTPEGILLPLVEHPVSPDGKLFTAIGPDHKAAIYPVEGGEPRPIPGLEPWDVPIRWSADERSLFVFRTSQVPARVYRLDLSTGRKQLWKELMPSDPAGVTDVYAVHLAADASWYFYTYSRKLSDLYLVDGLK